MKVVNGSEHEPNRLVHFVKMVQIACQKEEMNVSNPTIVVCCWLGEGVVTCGVVLACEALAFWVHWFVKVFVLGLADRLLP